MLRSDSANEHVNTHLAFDNPPKTPQQLQRLPRCPPRLAGQACMDRPDRTRPGSPITLRHGLGPRHSPNIGDLQHGAWISTLRRKKNGGRTYIEHLRIFIFIRSDLGWLAMILLCGHDVGLFSSTAEAKGREEFSEHFTNFN